MGVVVSFESDQKEEVLLLLLRWKEDLRCSKDPFEEGGAVDAVVVEEAAE
jgi:hypothetical protein